jgi:hypothetical protein
MESGDNLCLRSAGSNILFPLNVVPGQLSFELQGAVCCGVLLGADGRGLNLRRLAQKAFERNFGLRCRLSLQLSNARTKLDIFQHSAKASLGGVLRGFWIDALISSPSDLVGIAHKGLCDGLMALVG